MMNEVEQAVTTLRSGGVVLLPTDTVYGLAVKPDDMGAIDKLFALKARPKHVHLPIMVADVREVEMLGLEVNDNARGLLHSRLVPGALTFVLGFRPGRRLSWLEGRDEVAIRLPDNALLLEILRQVGPLLVTSANRHGQPVTPDNTRDILAQLSGLPDMVVDGGTCKEIPSTIVNCRHDPLLIERHGLVEEDEIYKIARRG
jgi:L-threonylcarbamoyladenylate synthase